MLVLHWNVRDLGTRLSGGLFNTDINTETDTDVDTDTDVNPDVNVDADADTVIVRHFKSKQIHPPLTTWIAFVTTTGKPMLHKVQLLGIVNKPWLHVTVVTKSKRKKKHLVLKTDSVQNSNSKCKN